MAHEERRHDDARVEGVAKNEVEVERGLVVARAAHGFHVQREYATLDPRHLVVLHEQDPTLAMWVCHEVTFVLKVLQASSTLLDGVKMVVQYYSF